MLYSDLSTAIQQYAECYEPTFVANIPNFVRATERRIYHSVQLLTTRKVQAVPLVSISEGLILLPSDFLSVHSVQVIPSGGVTPSYLLVKDYEFLTEAFPSSAYSDIPKYYALSPTNDGLTLMLKVGPTPDVVTYPLMTFTLNYYAMPSSIVDSNESWLGDNFDSALLWGAIAEGYVFLKGEADLLATYEQKFQQCLALLKQLGDAKDRQDTYRTPQTRNPVV